MEKFSSKVIDHRFDKTDAHGAISMPVYRTVSFEFPDSESIAAAFQSRDGAHTYSRISNPTVNYFESKIKAASGGQNVISMASGMAAISALFVAIAQSGANIVSSPHLFGNTFSFFKFTLADFGVEVRFVDTNNLQSIEAALDNHTCAFFAELITNPHLEIANFPEISQLLKSKNVPMIVDTTVIPWCGFDANICGVDVEITSTTKYISGGATSLGGVIIDHGRYDWSSNSKLARLPEPPENLSRLMLKLRTETARNLGACISPDAAHLQTIGLETLQVRYEKMSDTAFQLAKYLARHKKIAAVNYPALETSPYKPVADRIIAGNPGAMLTICLDNKAQCYRFMDKLKVFRRATNLFDNKSLVIHPESTIYGAMSNEMKALVGANPNLIRLSAGLEDTSDLFDDIDNALN
ncbi:MAG: PLP-dependent transferase [Prevotellaceae bacterium]|jgi:O-acetylhomoserine (thiol)-lyase|nr:PLP-dependent transferase [Prevotellaceae bacterium]